MHGDSAKPEAHMILALKLLCAAIERQKDILGDFFGGTVVAGDAQGDGKHHALVGLNQPAKVVVFDRHDALILSIRERKNGGMQKFCADRSAQDSE
jgi:hypothetical protein